MRANAYLFKKTLSKAFIEDIKSGKRLDVSVGFTYDTVDRKGEWQGEQYDYVQENLLINHVAVGVPVGRMRAPFIALGCDSINFEDQEPKGSKSVDSQQAPKSSQVPTHKCKPEVTLTPTTENTSCLIDKLRKLSNY